MSLSNLVVQFPTFVDFESSMIHFLHLFDVSFIPTIYPFIGKRDPFVEVDMITRLVNNFNNLQIINLIIVSVQL